MSMAKCRSQVEIPRATKADDETDFKWEPDRHSCPDTAHDVEATAAAPASSAGTQYTSNESGVAHTPLTPVSS